MPKRIRDIGPTVKRIRDTSPHPPSLDPAVVAAALGGELVAKREKGGGPVSAFIVRQGMARLIISRPAATPGSGNIEPVEIPIAEQEWKRLQELVDLMIRKGIHLSAGQIAGAMLKQALKGSEHEDPDKLFDELRGQLESSAP